MSTTDATTGRQHRTGRGALAVACVAALLLAGCGSSSGSDGASKTEAKPTSTTKPTTTTEAETDETTTPADDAEAGNEAGLPTSEADAPSGDWISVRFNVAIEPEPKDFNQGSAEARLYDIEPDCSGSGPCSLTFAGGGEGGSFGMPDTPEIPGDPLTLEPDGDTWVDTFENPEAFGCTDELDGPYLQSTEERSLEPVYGDDGEIAGLVGTVLFTDSLTDEGRAAGCPASSEATYAYATVVAPSDGIRGIDEYEVDGTFRQTLEVTKAEGYSDPRYQAGGLSTTLPDHDVELAGSCGGGECSVDLAQVDGDGDTLSTELTSEDGRGLLGSYDEESGCTDPESGDVVFDDGAYGTGTAYQDLTPIWIEDGQVKAFVGRYAHIAEPTDLGKTDPACSTKQSVEGWVYLVDTSVLA
ncbi:MAG: hypothetical protein JWO77_1324 [Ilumatobacteraceae bacterium]|nr:hypothetical protein [Ilumatobacteraceae bacterium]